MPTHYDALVLGSGIKESLISGILASRGKRVLQLDRQPSPGGSEATLDLAEVYERLEGGEKPDKKLGVPADYSFDLTPRVFLGAGEDLQLLVSSGLWAHMDFRRVHASYVYRVRFDGKPDVHRVLSKLEDVSRHIFLEPSDFFGAVALFLSVSLSLSHSSQKTSICSGADLSRRNSPACVTRALLLCVCLRCSRRACFRRWRRRRPSSSSRGSTSSRSPDRRRPSPEPSKRRDSTSQR